ncbi:MAG: EpsG family protein [Synergistaceae bacterium]|nr:EpsG family protein [Synergistaceae bacterium]
MAYMVMFTMSTFFAYWASRAKNRDVMIFFSVISIMIPCVMGGLRAYGVGNDTVTYAFPHFKKALNASTFWGFVAGDNKLSRELGWSFITYASTKLFRSLNVNFFIYQLITITCVYIGAYRHRKYAPFPFILLLFFLVYYNQTYNFMRQCIASSIIFMVLPDLEHRRYKRFIICVVIASMFHTSALIALIYFLGFHWLITTKMPDRLRNISLYGILLGIFTAKYMIAFITTTIPLLSVYQGFERYVDIGSYATSGLVFGSLLMFSIYKHGAQCVFGDEVYRFYTYNLAFNLLYRLMVSISATRLLFYFSFANVMLVASIPSIVREKSMKALYCIIVVFVSLVYWYTVYVIRVQFNGTLPYRSIIF